ncbi:hypothetical protein D1007_37342 [Hordeum vulgare]|nr:hypothetical protein D1007_37342 [Hordeum vulgare]
MALLVEEPHVVHPKKLKSQRGKTPPHSTYGLESDGLPSPLPTPGRNSKEWIEGVEEALKDSSLKEEQHALIATMLQGFQSVEARLHEVFNSFVTSFKVSTSVPTSFSKEIEEMNRKLERFVKDLDLMNQKFEHSQAAKAKEAQATKNVAQEKGQVRVLEVEETLKDVYKARDKLQVEEMQAKDELKKLHLAHSGLETAARSDRHELREVVQVAVGKPY